MVMDRENTLFPEPFLLIAIAFHDHISVPIKGDIPKALNLTKTMGSKLR